jgi:hypothetical protein
MFLTNLIATLSWVTKSTAKYILPWAPFPKMSKSSYRSHNIRGIFLIISIYSLLLLISGFDVPAVSYVTAGLSTLFWFYKLLFKWIWF